MSISETVRNRIIDAGGRFSANDNICRFIRDGELDLLKKEVEGRVVSVLKSLVIDVENDPNVIETAERISRMFIDEVFAGRYQPEPRVAYFPNAKGLDDLMVVGPITLRSTCSHHFAPITGDIWVGVLPSETVIGISKFSRLVRWVASRPQIQEDMAVQIADLLEEKIHPRGLAIYIRGVHSCMTWRGVKDSNSEMITSVMRGTFRDNPALRSEFMDIVKNGIRSR